MTLTADPTLFGSRDTISRLSLEASLHELEFVVNAIWRGERAGMESRFSADVGDVEGRQGNRCVTGQEKSLRDGVSATFSGIRSLWHNRRMESEDSKGRGSMEEYAGAKSVSVTSTMEMSSKNPSPFNHVRYSDSSSLYVNLSGSSIHPNSPLSNLYRISSSTSVMSDEPATITLYPASNALKDLTAANLPQPMMRIVRREGIGDGDVEEDREASVDWRGGAKQRTSDAPGKALGNWGANWVDTVAIFV